MAARYVTQIDTALASSAGHEQKTQLAADGEIECVKKSLIKESKTSKSSRTRAIISATTCSLARAGKDEDQLHSSVAPHTLYRMWQWSRRNYLAFRTRCRQLYCKS